MQLAREQHRTLLDYANTFIHIKQSNWKVNESQGGLFITFLKEKWGESNSDFEVAFFIDNSYRKILVITFNVW